MITMAVSKTKMALQNLQLQRHQLLLASAIAVATAGW
jgi:hypothetical protein